MARVVAAVAAAGAPTLPGCSGDCASSSTGGDNEVPAAQAESIKAHVKLTFSALSGGVQGTGWSGGSPVQITDGSGTLLGNGTTTYDSVNTNVAQFPIEKSGDSF